MAEVIADQYTSCRPMTPGEAGSLSPMIEASPGARNSYPRSLVDWRTSQRGTVPRRGPPACPGRNRSHTTTQFALSADGEKRRSGCIWAAHGLKGWQSITRLLVGRNSGLEDATSVPEFALQIETPAEMTGVSVPTACSRCREMHHLR